MIKVYTKKKEKNALPNKYINNKISCVLFQIHKFIWRCSLMMMIISVYAFIKNSYHTHETHSWILKVWNPAGLKLISRKNYLFDLVPTHKFFKTYFFLLLMLLCLTTIATSSFTDTLHMLDIKCSISVSFNY